MKKKIFLVTVNRSDFGIQKKLIQKLTRDKSIIFELIVTGSHLDKKFGLTYKEIINQNIKINNKIINKSKNYDAFDLASILGNGIKKFFNIYKKKTPDLLIILGDRYEMLSAVIPTILLNIPVAHIHGGEKTIGSFDDTIRNMITEVASLHFTCHETYKKRVIEIKNSKKNIYNFGSLSIEDIKNYSFQSKKYLQNKFKLKFGLKNMLITYHPETKNKYNDEKNFEQILIAIKKFKTINFFFTLPSPDPGNKKIISLTRKFCKKYENCFFISSFGKESYFSMLKNVDGVIGNSSSGIIEVPSFKIPTLNIGDRQIGRLQASSILNCKNISNQIEKNIYKMLDKNFKKKIKKTKNIFYKKNTAKNIISKIKKFTNVS